MGQIFATTRVSPSKQELSIPRKELNGVNLGSKKTIEIASELGIQNKFLHSDKSYLHVLGSEGIRRSQRLRMESG